MNAVELKNVSFRYDSSEEWVLRDADMTAAYGEITLLMGDSGCGKSTVLSLISGIIPDVTPGELKGEILINGNSIAGKGMSSICRKVGVVLQNADSQIIHKVVEDEIAFGCENFAFDTEKISRKIDEACSLMKLDKSWECRTLSGGQKQRLITACTLATEQKILIFDEPLANLDTEGTTLLMNALKKLAEDSYAVILVEHRIDRVIKYTDRIYRLAGGQITDYSNIEVMNDVIKDDRPSEVPGDQLFILDNISYKASGRTIIDRVSFEIKKGERLLLLGENGCGKTTLLRLIARLIKPSEGSLRQFISPEFGSTKKGTAKWFKKVGVVYQNPDYQLFMPTVRAEIEFGAADKGYADLMIERFSLSDIAERHPQSLSEGQKRKVTIAAVLASRPEVLLLDEPTVGQDLKGLTDMVHILNDIHQKTGNTMIAVTHDRRCAQALCDRALIFTRNGNIIEGDRNEAGQYLN